MLEKEKELNQIEIKQKALQRNWLIGFFAIMLIIAFIIFYYYRKTKAAKTKIEMLQREIHHRVKNNLSIIKRLVEVTQETIKDAKGRSSLNGLSNRIASMAQVHAQLYQKEDITHVDFKQYVNALCENIKLSFHRENLEIKLNIESGLDISFNKAIPLGLIVNELLTNAFKYASNGSDVVKIAVEIKETADKLTLSISDNGPGFSDGFKIQNIESYGLKLVNGLVQQLNGQIELANNNGANVNIEIPA
ncbi:MAG: sensor histidine kinase [Bacteroidales bacterium]